MEVRRRREQRGLTQQDLAALMGFSPQHLSAVECGETSVSEQFVQACDDALGADGQLVELLPPVVYERARARWSNRAAQHSDPVRSPPREPSPAQASAAPHCARRIPIAASTDVEVISAMIHALRRLDNRFGGGYAHGVVLSYLKDEVHPVLRMVQAQNTASRQVLQVVAELTQLAGWISHDVGKNRLARWYFGESLRLARASGDEAFTSEVLAGMSQQAAYLGDGRTAVNAAQAARRYAIRAGLPALLSEVAAMEAHGHALRGDASACLLAMRAAERSLDAVCDDRRPAWLEYFDRAYLAAKFAHALHALGELQPAERFAVRSLQMSEGYARGRLFNTVLLARIHAEGGDLDAACDLGLRSVAMAGGIRSARGRDYLADLARRLEPHAAAPQVRELREQIRSMGAV
jgi:transcriptional regulator with XRE-family HTH domain